MKVEKRYEYITRDGKQFTKWFSIVSNINKSDTDNFIKEYKKKSVNYKMHIKEEFRISNC